MQSSSIVHARWELYIHVRLATPLYVGHQHSLIIALTVVEATFCSSGCQTHSGTTHLHLAAGVECNCGCANILHEQWNEMQVFPNYNQCHSYSVIGGCILTPLLLPSIAIICTLCSDTDVKMYAHTYTGFRLEFSRPCKFNSILCVHQNGSAEAHSSTAL